jgi:mannose-1-phosphate guanylyltransferase
MGTHAALLSKVGERSEGNDIVGQTVVTGTGNRVFGNTDQVVVVAADNVTVVVTDSTVFVGAPDTDLKALVDHVSREKPDLV